MAKTGSADTLFCYGTLLYPQVMRAVAGAGFPRREAVLQGHARYRVRGEVFPGIVEQAGSEVHGCIYTGIGAAALRRIDAYESECYERRLLEIECGPGSMVAAWVYIVPPGFRACLDPVDWDEDDFRRRRLAGWLRALRTRGGGRGSGA